MQTLLEFYLQHLDFIYLNPDYRITNSYLGFCAHQRFADAYRADPTLADQQRSRSNPRRCGARTKSATSRHNWFWVPIVRQHLDYFDETNVVTLAESVAWIRGNERRIEDLFVDSSVVQSCKALTALKYANALKYGALPGSFVALPVSECVDSLGEVAAVDQGSDAVVSQVPESEGLAA